MEVKSSLLGPLLIIIILSIYSIQMQTAEAAAATKPVRIVNNLLEPGYPLGMRCKSRKGEDKGLQSLDLGQEFRWDAELDSHWDCDFLDWNFREIVFSVYNANFSQKYCRDICNWSVRFNGFYIAGVNNPSPGDYTFFKIW